MRWLMCCTLVPEKYEVEIKEISNAGNRFISNFCTKLEEWDSVEILSYIGININSALQDEICSLSVKSNSKIKYCFRSKKIIKGVLKMMQIIWCEMKRNDCIITYNVIYAWIFAPICAKIMKKKSFLILADYSPTISYTSKIQQLYAKIQQFFIRRYDYVIGLSENTKKYLTSKQIFLCLEGGIDKGFYDKFEQYRVPQRNKITLMYSGILEKVTGVDLLVNAFSQADVENVQLVITGDGSLRECLEQVANVSNNITYLGCIPYEEYISKLQEADILINPRNMSLPENQYNFPSKIMEYLATGKMIVSTKFPGWERYKEYIRFCESSIEDIRKEIISAINDIDNWSIDAFSYNREYAKTFFWERKVEAVRTLLPENLRDVISI